MVEYLGRIVTEQEMIKDLRKRGCDVNNSISDEFLISEAYAIGEWNFI